MTGFFSELFLDSVVGNSIKTIDKHFLSIISRLSDSVIVYSFTLTLTTSLLFLLWRKVSLSVCVNHFLSLWALSIKCSVGCLNCSVNQPLQSNQQMLRNIYPLLQWYHFQEKIWLVISNKIYCTVKAAAFFMSCLGWKVLTDWMDGDFWSTHNWYVWFYWDSLNEQLR